MIKVKQSESAEIFNDFIPDLTPLLDVLFILIFFLILTTNTLPYKIDLDYRKIKKALQHKIKSKYSNGKNISRK